MTFPEYGSDYSFASNEEKVLDFWRKRKVFERSLDKAKGRPTFYFYDGPPFATGTPHYGHIIGGTLKDMVPRYWSMRGYYVPRRFGWDTHGLPVEFEMEKTLNLNGSTAIREYGVGKFNEACRGIVLRYTGEWRKTVERMGRWVDMDNDYRTMNPEFMESVWWVFKELWNKGLVYEGKKVVPYSWRLTAPLSNFEASLNYKDIQDPAITVLLPLATLAKNSAWVGNTALAVWTTTPWTLPSNLAVAVQGDAGAFVYGRYKLAQAMGAVTHVVVGKPLAEKYGLKDADLEGEIAGADLVGAHYSPLFSVFEDAERKKQNAFRVLDGSKFVTATDGTGLVHMAPAFGEDDFFACQEAGIGLVDPIDMEANFTAEVERDPRLAAIKGLNFKDADKPIIKALKDSGRLLKHETLNHAYPHCERTDTPLMYKAIPSWFVKVESLRDRMVTHNKKIHWVPGHIRDGRFGKWLENARDWCISRNRFWGTPIPVWTCSKCGDRQVAGSRADLTQILGRSFDDLHMHFLDEHAGDCPKCHAKGSVKRTSEVLDCWFESGSMPYAQEHYPFENKDKLDKSFPANFIAEGLDQTRGWFYTLTVLSTALFDKPAFQNCIVNGIVLAEDGRKMSKRLKNYPDPLEIMGKYGADAMRLYLLQSPAAAAEELRFSEKGLLELMRAVMLPLWNAYSFFASYANIDGWSWKDAQAPGDRTLLDQWILARTHETALAVHKAMESYEVSAVAPHLVRLIDDLTNWYIRLNRDRFWAEGDAKSSADKRGAYTTLWTVLDEMTRLLAPGLPYLAEVFHAALRGRSLDRLVAEDAESVHESHYAKASELSFDEKSILSRVNIAQRAILLGRALRGDSKIGLRQPLSKLTVAGVAGAEVDDLIAMKDLVLREVNVKDLVIAGRAADLVEESVKPNFKSLGKKVGGAMKAIQAELAKWGTTDIHAFEAAREALIHGHRLTVEDIEIVRKAKPGKLAQSLYGLVAELDTQITPELEREGLEREIINRIQQRRKEMKLHLADRIRVSWWASAGSKAETVLREESAKAGALSAATLAVGFLTQPSRTDFQESFDELGSIGFEITKV
jgi:isoleucyl-tRNA synthetase